MPTTQKFLSKIAWLTKHYKNPQMPGQQFLRTYAYWED